MKEIGFVGLGAMGSAMAPLLSKADFNVYGYDIKNLRIILRLILLHL